MKKLLLALAICHWGSEAIAQRGRPAPRIEYHPRETYRDYRDFRTYEKPKQQATDRLHEQVNFHIAKRARAFGYSANGNNSDLLLSIKDGDDLSVILRRKFTNEDIDRINRKYGTAIRYQAGKYEDYLFIDDLISNSGHSTISFFSTKGGRGKIDLLSADFRKMLLGYKGVVWMGHQISPALAKFFRNNGLLFIQSVQSVRDPENLINKTPKIIVYSSEDPKEASRIFEGQDGKEIARITKLIRSDTHFILVKDLIHLKVELNKQDNSRSFVVFHNRPEVRRVIENSKAHSITCNAYQQGTEQFQSTDLLDYESIIRAFKKTDKSAHSLAKTMSDFSKNYENVIKLKSAKIKGVLISAGVLAAGIITAMYIVSNEEPSAEKLESNIA